MRPTLSTNGNQVPLFCEAVGGLGLQQVCRPSAGDLLPLTQVISLARRGTILPAAQGGWVAEKLTEYRVNFGGV